ncbi:RNA polymerase sigma factor [Nocardioides sp.]|uniref:RNA polymerase sigma factor n=1 Tax=Nocardioides sp. TaxID=35761 RepID=UPI002ED1831C
MHDADFPVRLRAAQAGDELAFAELFRAVQPQLLRYLGALTSNLADGTADDVAAETWVQVVRGLDRFRGDEQGFRAWVFTIARAKLVDARRRSGRLPVPDDVEQRLAEVGVPSAAEAVEQLLTTEQALALVGSLPAKHAEVVLLRYVAGFDVKETARILGRTEGAVRVTAHRALRRLEEILVGSSERPCVTEMPSESVRGVK